ncbi:Periplasmic component of the Tol biopolymer transport system [Geosmithia morbida]|uniref:Periplasmic component of the Tol biopolymer transport system n=1 Tax=Geosmithia morbida TaxID=1094350 RepID=A0A9P4YV17_9HYPO|nr:Periplasmic component of the Tol biopolymer transport system [Geosmithia morbida]KAF4123042.1 Periplasmic component of the Tol biopolymer transport system [Geosmithia morbida]
MKLQLLTILAAAAGQALAACPYAKPVEAVEPRACPYAGKAQEQSSAQAEAASLKRRTPPADDKKGVFYLNRIGPSGSALWISNSDGTDARQLMANQTDPFDYHANWSPDGEWIVFTSERAADGQADLYRVKPDGGSVETLVASSSLEDSGTLSPDGTKLAYVSTAINYTANIFVKDLVTGKATNLTGSDESVGSFVGPHSFYRPSWSPDGRWVAFSSDANTQWTGHSDGTGWEHTQELSVYIAHPDGTGFRKVIGQDGYSLGSPRWSPDGSRLVYYNMTTEATYNVHGSSGQQSSITSQIFSVDVETGTDIVQHTTDATPKVTPSYIGGGSNGTDANIAYVVKAGTQQGIHYTSTDSTHTYVNATIRNPSWSPDGKRLVYEVNSWTQRQAEKPLYSWDHEWEYRFMDVFPQINNATGRLATTAKQLGNASSNVLLTDADYSNPVTAFDVYDINSSAAETALYASGLAGAFQPTWSPTGTQLIVGFGVWFFNRVIYPATLYLMNADDSGNYKNLTDGTLNAGFPSYSPDGNKVVYRLWNWTEGPLGLYVMDLRDETTTRITDGWDNTPGWSPDGELIVFTRQTNWTSGPSWDDDRFDICTCKPDGSDIKILTESQANDAHAVWSPDGRILYSSGMYGFRDESALYDETFQPYGQIISMNADGSNKTMLTDSLWEDSMPMFIDRSYF